MFFKQTSKGFIAMKNVESGNFDGPILIFSRFCPL
jgi:hypothetical protein